MAASMIWVWDTKNGCKKCYGKPLYLFLRNHKQRPLTVNPAGCWEVFPGFSEHARHNKPVSLQIGYLKPSNVNPYNHFSFLSVTDERSNLASYDVCFLYS